MPVHSRRRRRLRNLIKSIHFIHLHPFPLPLPPPEDRGLGISQMARSTSILCLLVQGTELSVSFPAH